MTFRFAVAAALALGAATSAAATVINFDDLTGFSAVPTFYEGVHWNSFVHYDTPQNPYNAHSGETRVFGDYAVYGFFDNGPITFTVGAGSVFDGFWAAGAASNLNYELYLGGVLQATSATITLTDTPTFLASGFAGSIDEVRINTANGLWVGDDFTFSTLNALGAVPEPATWGLMLTGFGLAGTALRRRRQAVVDA